MTMTALAAETAWIDICACEDIPDASGVAALIDGRQVALVRLRAAIYAIDHFDPFSQAMVMARGIVGDVGGIPKIASPIYKQCFDLRSGQCFDDPAVSLRIWPVRVVDGRVQVGRAPA